jgi:hypothetical protein
VPRESPDTPSNSHLAKPEFVYLVKVFAPRVCFLLPASVRLDIIWSNFLLLASRSQKNRSECYEVCDVNQDSQMDSTATHDFYQINSFHTGFMYTLKDQKNGRKNHTMTQKHASLSRRFSHVSHSNCSWMQKT